MVIFCLTSLSPPTRAETPRTSWPKSPRRTLALLAAEAYSASHSSRLGPRWRVGYPEGGRWQMRAEPGRYFVLEGKGPRWWQGAGAVAGRGLKSVTSLQQHWKDGGQTFHGTPTAHGGMRSPMWARARAADGTTVRGLEHSHHGWEQISFFSAPFSSSSPVSALWQLPLGSPDVSLSPQA